ncbi:MAG: M55 family metallopeptidase [Anaerolineales bacterium]|nr:M55 family metallopeptidase [Anaerolineales bacterium]
MRVFISVDMEGITGVTCWDDTDKEKPSYERFRKMMTAEVNAAIEGALLGKAKTILVNDSHGGMRNILIEELNPKAQLISGTPKPLGMMCGVDSGVDVAFLVGCHAREGTPKAILNHTWSSSRVHRCYFNGMELGEIGFNAALAGHFGVPVALVVGDQAATEEARALLGNHLQTIAVKQAFSREAARNLSPEYAHGRIRMAAQEAIFGPKPDPLVVEPPVTVGVEFKTTIQAEKAALMPGSTQVSGNKVEWTGENVVDAFNAMRAMIAMA